MTLREWLGKTVIVATLGTASFSSLAEPSVRVEEAWVRATVPGQRVGAGYLTLVADQPLRLVGVNTPAAAATQIHVMVNDNGVMKMREVKQVELRAGQAVRLVPGGTHLMLLDLRDPLKEGQLVRLALTLEDGAGRRSNLSIDVPVRRMPIQ